MADHQRYSLLFLALFSCLVCSSYSYQFDVVGKDGWVVNWAGRTRFQVDDTLLFKDKSEADSVVVVNKDDYDKCNAANPITKLDDLNPIFKLDRSGPFYFISSNKSNCDMGQKLTADLDARTPPPPPSPPKPPLPPPPSPSPADASPEPSSSSTTPGSPNSSTPGWPGSTLGSTTPADSNAPPPCRSCVFLMSAASVVVSVGLGVFV